MLRGALEPSSREKRDPPPVAVSLSSGAARPIRGTARGQRVKIDGPREARAARRIGVHTVSIPAGLPLPSLCRQCSVELLASR